MPRTFLSSEKNYSQIEKEVLEIIFAVKNFKFIHGIRFTIDGPPSIVIYFRVEKKGYPNTHSVSTIAMEAAILLNYIFQMKFLPSKMLRHGDGLSKLVHKLCEPLEATVIAGLRAENEIKNVLCNNVGGSTSDSGLN